MEGTKSDSVKKGVGKHVEKATLVQKGNMASTLEEMITELTATINSKSNIIIDGLLESAEETFVSRKELVKNFFKEQMEIEQDIEIKDAFRIGKSIPKAMLVTLAVSDDKEIVFSNVAKLKGKTNARKKLFFESNDLTDDDKEQRAYFSQLRKEILLLDQQDRLEISLRKGRLFANNEIIRNKVQVPQCADILTLNQEEIQELKEVKVYQVETHQEKGSEFRSFYQRVTSTQEVQDGLAKLKIKHGDASHIAVAYRLDAPKGPFKQGYNDNGETGTGRKILQELNEKDVKKVAVFVVRYYGGTQLGKRRFEIYADMARKAAQSFSNKMEKFTRKSRNERSVSQLSQLSQLLEMSQEETAITDRS